LVKKGKKYKRTNGKRSLLRKDRAVTKEKGRGHQPGLLSNSFFIGPSGGKKIIKIRILSHDANIFGIHKRTGKECIIRD